MTKCKNCGHELEIENNRWVHLTKVKIDKYLFSTKHPICLNIVKLRNHCACVNPVPEKEVKK